MGFDPRRIPIIGDDIYQVGQVVDLITQPCQPDPTILVKAFFANLPTLIWSFVKPDIFDMTQERFGRAHKRKRKRRFNLYDFSQVPAGPKGSLRWASFRGVQLEQRIGWYFLVADATSDFLINWTSMAYQYSGCHTPNSGWASTGSSAGFQAFSVGEPITCGLGTPAFSTSWLANNSSIQKLTSGPRSVAAGIEFATPTHVPASPLVEKVELIEVRGGVPIAHNIDVIQPTGGAGTSATYGDVSYEAQQPPSSYGLRFTAAPGWVRVGSWYIQGSGTDQKGYQHDP